MCLDVELLFTVCVLDVDVLFTVFDLDVDVRFTVCVLDVDVLSECDVMGRTALMYAVQYSCLDTLQILLDQGAAINALSNGMFTIVVQPFL